MYLLREPAIAVDLYRCSPGCSGPRPFLRQTAYMHVVHSASDSCSPDSIDAKDSSEANP